MNSSQPPKGASLANITDCFFLAGPTAVGKTDAALAVAEAFGGEIVGADAFQVYQGLDILTAKPSQAERARAPHHLVDAIPLSESFNVGRYLELARLAIGEIRNRGRLPIITGGTGMYLRALTRGLANLPQASPELREQLSATPLPKLLERLEALDPTAASTIDRQNPRRVIRALEVCITTGKPFSSFREQWEAIPPIHGLYLTRSREELCDRINRRTIAMFEHGVVEEVANLLKTGPESIGETARQVLGLREIESLLKGEISEANCIAAIQQATRQYAKRQATWFRREPMFVPVSLDDPDAVSEVIRRAKATLKAD